MSESPNSSWQTRDEPRFNNFTKTIFPAVALLLITIATAFRFYHLGHRSIWYDEAVTANISHGSFTEVLQKTRHVSAPVVHPYLLYLVERVAQGAVAVRMPSAVASVLVVLVILAMVRANVSPYAALISATILTVSASQIRYAQEVREYSLAVLCATCLIYCLLRWESAGSPSRHPIGLYALLFLAPLIQYGLVFFSFAVLTTIALRILLTRNTSFKVSHAFRGFMSLAAGSLLTYFLTARFQFRPGGGQWYLAGDYFDPSAGTLTHFLGTNLMGLMQFVIVGRLRAICCATVAAAFCFAQLITRKVETITILVLTSVICIMLTSVARVYPFGGVRQCIFLAPGLVLLVGVACADFLKRLKGSVQPTACVGLMALIIFSSHRGMRTFQPYGEFEDTQSILNELGKLAGPNDQIFVFHNAVEPLQFYLDGKDHRFIYGKLHPHAPQEYVPEILASIDPHNSRFWLVFSHLGEPSDHMEEQLVVNLLRSNWNLKCVIAPARAALFLATRKNSP